MAKRVRSIRLRSSLAAISNLCGRSPRTHGREILLRQCLQDEARAPGLERHLAAIAGALDLDLGALRQLADDVEERVRRDRGGARARRPPPPRVSTIVRSMSVAVSASMLSPASSRTLERIGMVLRRSTTLCTCASDFKRAPRSMVSFMSRSGAFTKVSMAAARRTVAPRFFAAKIARSLPADRGANFRNQSITIAKALEKVSELRVRWRPKYGRFFMVAWAARVPDSALEHPAQELHILGKARRRRRAVPRPGGPRA